MRLLVVSERLRRPYDEGIKNVAVNLVRALSSSNEVMALTTSGTDDPDAGIRNVPMNRAFLSARLLMEVRRFAPEGVLYIPTACATLFSMLRSRILGAYARGALTVLLTLQPRTYSSWGRMLASWLAPDWVVSQSQRTASDLEKLGCRTGVLPPAVDGTRFGPASPKAREALRLRYGIPLGSKVICHVGHLKEKRSLSQMLELGTRPGYVLLVVASTSTEGEPALRRQIIQAGAKLIERHLSNIEEMYQMSDAYLFLAEDPTAAIELPLSVLEAMACNLPVVCTAFGALDEVFVEGAGLFFWDRDRSLPRRVEEALSTPCRTRDLVKGYSWDAAARNLQDLFAVGTSHGI